MTEGERAMATIARVQSKAVVALLLGAAMLCLPQVAWAQQGERVTVLIANQGFDDAAFAHSVVVLQRGGDEEVGVIINRPSDYELGDVLDVPATEKAADPLYSG